MYRYNFFITHLIYQFIKRNYNIFYCITPFFLWTHQRTTTNENLQTKKMHPRDADAFLKFNVQASQLSSDNFLATVDVDARNGWLAVELLTVEVVPLVALAVNTNCADCAGVILGNSHINCTVEVSQN